MVDQNKIKALLNDQDFLFLANRYQVTNIFQVSGMGSQEIKHSNMLAWLLDPTETHGLKDSCVKGFLSKLYDENPEAQGSLQNGIVDLLLDDLCDAAVSRETENNIDVLFRTNNKRLVICLENKIWAPISDGQLDKYSEYIESHYADYDYRIYVLLSPSGEGIPEGKAGDPDIWLPCSYKGVAECLEDLRSKASDEKTKLLITDYLDLLKRRGIVEDIKEQQMIDRLYRQHKDVFDLVSERRGSTKTLIEDALRPLYVAALKELGREGKIIPWESYEDAAQYIGFSSPEMNKCLPFDNDISGTWDNGGATYWYWIYPDSKVGLLAPTIKLELGPLNHSEDTIKRMDSVRAFFTPNARPIDKTNRYRRLKTVPTGIDERETVSPEDINAEKIKVQIKKAILEMLDIEKEYFSL